MFHAPGSLILTGKSKGVVLRGALHIDDWDVADGEVKVFVPGFITSLRTDFFFGVFEKSVLALGREAFLGKYCFECPPTVMADVERGIECVLAGKSEPALA